MTLRFFYIPENLVSIYKKALIGMNYFMLIEFKAKHFLICTSKTRQWVAIVPTTFYPFPR